MHASLGSRSASRPAGVVLLATTAGILGCGGGATVPEGPDEPEVEYGLLEVTLAEAGSTRDWGGFFLELEEIGGDPGGGGSFGRIGGLGNPVQAEVVIPAGQYAFVTWDVDPHCTLSGPPTVTIPPEASASATLTLECGALDPDPAPGLLAVTWAGTYVLARPDGTSMTPFLPPPLPGTCGSFAVRSPPKGRTAAGAYGPEAQASDAQAPCEFVALEWCGDGSRIALRSGILSGDGIYATSGTGTDLTRLDDGSLTLDLSSPVTVDRDCTRVAFATSDVGTPSIHSIPLDGGDLTLIAESASHPAWSPVDDRLALVRDGQVEILDDTGSFLNLGPGQCPGWSPDGARLAWVDAGQLWVGNADGSGEPLSLVTNPLGIWCPRWSPDGEWIAYRADASFGPLTYRDVFLLRVADGHGYRLTWWDGWSELAAVWVPPGAPVAAARR